MSLSALTLTLTCLSNMVYYEARGESLSGQIKVAAVAINRANISKKDVCSVIYAPYQFSPHLAKRQEIPLRRKPVQVVASLIALLGLYTTPATHFESKGNYLERTFGLKHIATIGGHRFYVEKCYNVRCVSGQQPAPNFISAQ